MVHPLSSEKEIEFYLQESSSEIAITLDQFCEKFTTSNAKTMLSHLIITQLSDELSSLKRFFSFKSHTRKIPDNPSIILWKDFLCLGNSYPHHLPVPMLDSDPAVILYSGGTTGSPKGVTLSNLNFNALAKQIRTVNPAFCPGDKMLAALPMFHGFGLGVCIHSMLYNGGRCILLPRFTPKSYSYTLLKYKCDFITGVPALFASLLEQRHFGKKDLSFLKGVFCGGDTLSEQLQSRFDSFLLSHGSKVTIREGYGTTESASACCLMPENNKKTGSVGLPLPGMDIKIYNSSTGKECPPWVTGEILVSGPTVMLGYRNHPEETVQSLQHHEDGLLWLCTGDLGKKDHEGYLYFCGRKKRMIISSGYNIYPSQLESILESHEAISKSCVIGIPDPVKGQRVKAYIQLKENHFPTNTLKLSILEHCRIHMAQYAIPSQIEYLTKLPMTPMGKIDFRRLENFRQSEDNHK